MGLFLRARKQSVGSGTGVNYRRSMETHVGTEPVCSVAGRSSRVVSMLLGLDPGFCGFCGPGGLESMDAHLVWAVGFEDGIVEVM